MSVHCIVQTETQAWPGSLSHQLTGHGQWSASLQSPVEKGRGGFRAMQNILLEKYEVQLYPNGQNIMICPTCLKALNCDFTVRTEISTCLLYSHRTCGWLGWKCQAGLILSFDRRGGSEKVVLY